MKSDDVSALLIEGERSGLPYRYDRVQPALLASFRGLVRDLGGDRPVVQPLLDRHANLLGGEPNSVSYRQAVDLLAAASVVLGCPDFGMRLAKRQSGVIDSALMQLFLNCTTLGEALSAVVEHSYAHSLAAAIWVQSDAFDDSFMLGHDILLEGLTDPRQAIEQIFLITYLTWIEATSGGIRARRVHFRHQPVASPSEYRRHFGCEVHFEQSTDAIVFANQVLSCPITAPDIGSYRRAVATVLGSFSDKEQPLKAAVRHAIVHRIWDSACTNDVIATSLNMHVRMLHRKLTEEGTTFQRIKNEVRRDFMIHYLDHTDLPIAWISDRLGFAEQSAMTRFCRQFLKQSPSLRRRTIR